MSANVNTTPGYGDYLGAQAASSDVAELHGIGWAMMFGVQFGGRLATQIEICFDSTYAFGMGTCVYKPHH